jgi:hypothetical protein
VKFILALISAVLVVSCGKNINPKAPLFVEKSTLIEKQVTYLELIEKHRGPSGWIKDYDCDGLLFNSIAKVSGVEGIDLHKAFDGDRWYRSPSKDCYPDRSKSTISRDMLLGVLLYSAITRDSSIPESLLAYGEENGWMMGEGVISRTWFSFNLRRISAEIIKLVTGNELDKYLKIPLIVTGTKEGYQAHLESLILLIKGEWGSLDQLDFLAVRSYYRRNPDNAVFSYLYHRYADGDFSGTVRTLLDEGLFPSDRLPTNRDRCTEYLWQREKGVDWQPCEKERFHSGIDFLFMSYLVLREI